MRVLPSSLIGVAIVATLFRADATAALDLSADPAPSPSFDKRVEYSFDNRIVATVDVEAYQNNEGLSEVEDFHRGREWQDQESWIVRLGRKDDMILISAFRRDGEKICSKHLLVRIRDGANIRIQNTTVAGFEDHEVWRILFGRKGDLVAWYGVRWGDFQFVFDPRPPRFEPRNITTAISQNGQFPEHDVVDGGCN